MATLTQLSDLDLATEANLAADIARTAPTAAAQAEAYDLLTALLCEAERRQWGPII